MSDIATKLTYLNTTKQKIKDSINNIGGNITSETTFRQYVAALESIYQSMPKVSGTGTTLSLSPTLKGLMQSTLKGNTYQKTIAGNQLFDYTNTDNYVNSGNSNLTKITNGIRIATTNQGTNRFASVILGEYSNFSGKTISISGTITPSSTNNSSWQLWYMNSSKSLISQIDSNTNTNFTKTLTSSPPTNTYYLALVLYNTRSVTSVAGMTTDFTNIMINEGSTYLPYEEYVGSTPITKTPSPNPDFPQDIHNVSGNNSIVVCGKNLCNNISLNLALVYTNETIITDATSGTMYAKVPKNTDITITKTDITNRFRVGLLNKIPEANDTFHLVYKSDNSSVLTTTINTMEYEYVAVQYTNQSQTTNIMINVGTQPTTYEAYNGTTYPINLPSGMELSKIGTYQDYIYKDSDKWYLHKEIGKVLFDGSEEWQIGNTGTSNWYYYFNSSYIPIQNIQTSSYGLCSHYNIANIGNNNTNQGISLLSNGILRVRYGTEDTTTNYKTWLSTHNIELYYVLGTTTYTEITDSTLLSQLEAIYNAKSKNGTTNINQENNDLSFILDVSALLGSGS